MNCLDQLLVLYLMHSQNPCVLSGGAHSKTLSGQGDKPAVIWSVINVGWDVLKNRGRRRVIKIH